MKRCRQACSRDNIRYSGDTAVIVQNLGFLFMAFYLRVEYKYLGKLKTDKSIVRAFLNYSPLQLGPQAPVLTPCILVIYERPDTLSLLSPDAPEDLVILPSSCFGC